MPLPDSIPETAAQLISELDKYVPRAEVDFAIQPDRLPQINFEAGRRSVVNELLAMQERQKNR